MKHKLLVFSVLVLFLVLAGETMAASKPPATICLSLDPTVPGTAFFTTLTVKSIGNVKMVNGQTNIYAISGFIFTPPGGPQWDYPLAGTGHMYKSEPDVFHFSVTGSTLFSGVYYTTYLEGYWDVVDKKGLVSAKTAGTVNNVTANVVYSLSPSEVSCDGVEIP